MRLLISNDDGVYAPGIKQLYEEFRGGYDVTVVAPLEERSTTGHSLHLNTVLRLEKVEEKIYGCSGFPADCILMGIGHLLKKSRPDIVISGINRGPNLGQDLYYSGTVAAAREATFHGIPSIAVSLNISFTKNEPAHYYDSASKYISLLLKENIAQFIPQYTLLNVNVPNLSFDEIKGVKFTQIGFRNYSDDIEERIDCRNRKYYWIGGTFNGNRHIAGTDGLAIDEGYISVTPHVLIDSINVDLSNLKTKIENIKLK